MKAQKGDVIVDLWCISKDVISQPDWVTTCFSQQIISWGRPQDGAMPDRLVRLEGGWIMDFGKIGQYLELDRGKVSIIGKRRFNKDYKIIDGE